MIGLLFCLAAVQPAPPSWKFDHLPLGSAARVLSARYHVPITLLARAKAPITGDFTGLDLPHALASLARQAGLAVMPQGKGFVIGPAAALTPAPAAMSAGAAGPAPAVSAAEQRAALLHRRAELLAAMPPDR